MEMTPDTYHATLPFTKISGKGLPPKLTEERNGVLTINDIRLFFIFLVRACRLYGVLFH